MSSGYIENLNRPITALATSAALLLSGCAHWDSTTKPTTSSSSEHSSPGNTHISPETNLSAAEHEAHIISVLREKGASAANMALLAKDIYASVAEATATATPVSQVPPPASSVAILEQVYGTDFGISRQSSPESAEQALGESGEFIDVTHSISSADLPYLPGGLLVIKKHDTAPGFRLSITLGRGSEQQSRGRALLGSAAGI